MRSNRDLSIMITIFDLLAQADGSQLTRDRWGERPRFQHYESLHLGLSSSADGTVDISVTAVFATWEHGDFNRCKPSKVVLRFCDVSRLEYLGACGDHPAHGIALDTVFTSG